MEGENPLRNVGIILYTIHSISRNHSNIKLDIIIWYTTFWGLLFIKRAGSIPPYAAFFKLLSKVRVGGVWLKSFIKNQSFLLFVNPSQRYTKNRQKILYGARMVSPKSSAGARKEDMQAPRTQNYLQLRKVAYRTNWRQKLVCL